MAQVIQAGIEGFEAMIYPDQNPMNYQFIQNQFANLGTIADKAVNDFYQRAKESAERLYNSAAVRHAKAAVRAIRNVFQTDSIGYLPTLDQIQQANPRMVRYIMAEPTIRQLYQEQMCCGYGESYVDNHPGTLGKEHYDYRRVMNGVVNEVVDPDGTTHLEHSEFVELLLDEDRELEFHEKVGVIRTWDLVKLFVAEGKDPTSPEGDDL
jgi:hypothetical protein